MHRRSKRKLQELLELYVEPLGNVSRKSRTLHTSSLYVPSWNMPQVHGIHTPRKRSNSKARIHKGGLSTNRGLCASYDTTFLQTLVCKKQKEVCRNKWRFVDKPPLWIRAIESIQRQAARFVLHDYRRESSVTTMLSSLGWDTLQHRRLLNQCEMLFKVHHKLVQISLPPDIRLITGITRPQRAQHQSHNFRFTQPFCRVNCYMYSMFPRAVRVWNTLPSNAVTANTILGFRGAALPAIQTMAPPPAPEDVVTRDTPAPPAHCTLHIVYSARRTTTITSPTAHHQQHATQHTPLQDSVHAFGRVLLQNSRLVCNSHFPFIVYIKQNCCSLPLHK